jgi:hypothetical protein
MMSGKITDDIIMKVGQGIMRIPRNQPQRPTGTAIQKKKLIKKQKRENREKKMVGQPTPSDSFFS